MSRFHSYINNALAILNQYKGDIPFSVFIKNFFSKEKKFGSSDRKQISAICYNYLRVGLFFKKELSAETLLSATFICVSESSLLINNLKPEWNEKITNDIAEKLLFLNYDTNLENIFPFKEELNEKIEFDLFCLSIITQPALFIRVRPGHTKSVLKKIRGTSVAFTALTEGCLQFSTGINIESFLKLDEEFVIQDYNSQQVLSYLSKHCTEFQSMTDLKVWDCCAASGGKSILLNDALRSRFKLTVSDLRPGIITSLLQRFKRAAIKNYTYFIADLSKPVEVPGDTKFNIIICDAPCSGSGTWSRTPEQLYFFNPADIQKFSTLQKNILDNTVPHLKENGLFFYITCSVFKQENEIVANYIQQELKLQLLEIKNLWGYQHRADSMFVAVFKKP